MSNRIKNFCFTLNNYNDLDISALQALDIFQYLIYGFEVGEEGTPHLQGYAELHKKTSFTVIKRTLGPKYHIEKRNGTSTEAAEYCKKDGNYVEKGVISKPGSRNDLNLIKDLIMNKNGKMPDVIDQCTSYQALRGAQIMLTYRPYKSKDMPKSVHWFWGSTGTGKTKSAIDLAGNDPFWISSDNLKWFDGYWGQKVAIFDDFRKDYCTFHFLLRLLDRYPLKVPIKGGFVEWEPDVIYITSCFPPSQVYQTREDVGQLLRRIKEIRKFELPYTDILYDNNDKELIRINIEPIDNCIIDLGNLSVEDDK